MELTRWPQIKQFNVPKQYFSENNIYNFQVDA